jgi:diaminohydroxyphosphoribosylaminopyrimidine deaminase/5-amino-6-(5-phosphoribosylamino)uracil reductase
MVATTRGSDPMRRAELEKVGGEVLELPRGAKGVDLRALFEELGKRGIVSVLIEGGGEINASALSAGLVDKLCLFMAPRIIGGREAPGVIGGEGVRLVAEAPQMRVHEVKRVGPDLMLVAYPLR